MEARAAKENETGKKARGKAPEEEMSGKVQVNLTDEDLRIMPGGILRLRAEEISTELKEEFDMIIILLSEVRR